MTKLYKTRIIAYTVCEAITEKEFIKILKTKPKEIWNIQWSNENPLYKLKWKSNKLYYSCSSLWEAPYKEITIKSLYKRIKYNLVDCYIK